MAPLKSITTKEQKIKKSKIVTWKPNPDDCPIHSDGKIFYLEFDKVFRQPNLAGYNRFYIKKSSYEKQLDVIVRYINFFMEFYDTENEMANNYLKIKYSIDHDKRFGESNAEELIDLIYEIFFTDSIIQKINQLVEDNYLDDIESSEESKKYINKERKHLESLEFTNKHIKMLLRISFGMKCISPIMLHYVFMAGIKIDKDSDLIYNFYRRLFDIFTDGVQLYNKLFVYVSLGVH